MLAFKEDLAVILISLPLHPAGGHGLDLAQLWQLGPMVLALLCVVQFVARPLCILVSTRGSDCPLARPRPARLDSPRGIVAAAVSASFAIQHARGRHRGCRQAGALVFAVIIFTVVLQSLTATPLIARHAPERPQCLAAHRRQLGPGHRQALADQGIPVQLSDPAWEHCKLARMAACPATSATPV